MADIEASTELSVVDPKRRQSGQDGVFTPLEETIDSFEAVINGDLDHLPEQAFQMVGGAEDAERKAAELQANA